MKIHNSLKSILDRLSEFRIEEHLAKFKNTKHFQDLENQFKDFQYDVGHAADRAKESIESPIYVGVIGHYSHGKSSLLNAMLFPPKAKDLLPTGESIVTSKCTLIQFKEGGRANDFYEVSFNGDERPLSEEEYQAKVSGKRESAIQDLHFFRLVLSASDLAGEVFGDMAVKNIQLLDTPGLGGPYWKDEQSLQQWVKEFMLLIVCVKADAINSRTANVINPFLRQTARPVIPVITFWDLWQEAESFRNISDEALAREKAQKDLKEYLPTLADAVDENRTIFVSARNYHLSQEVPESAKHYSTPQWNIDNLRRSMSSYVSAKSNILRSGKTEESCLERRRREGVLNECCKLTQKFGALKPQLLRVMDTMRPKEAYEEQLNEDIEQLKDKVVSEYERIIDRLDQIISDSISAIPVNGKLTAEFSNIQEAVSKELQQQISDQMQSKLKRQMDKTLIRHLERYFEDETPLDDHGKKRINEKVRDLCDDLLEGLCKPGDMKPFNPPQGVTDLTKNITSALISGMKQLMITNFPMFIGLVLAVPLGGFLLKALTWIPFVGDKIKNVIWPFFLIFLVVWGLTVTTLFWNQFKNAMEKTCLQVKEKARKTNRRADIRGRIMPGIESRIQDFHHDLLEDLRDGLQKVVDSSTGMLDEMADLIKDVDTDLKTIDRECADIARSMRT
ncbi:MAG TPA: dynamin family protein [bacterium]|nr:dynamin family protein [bacterium]